MKYTEKVEELPANREYYEELNNKAEELGLDYLKVIIDGDYVYKDELHRFLGIGIKLDS